MRAGHETAGRWRHLGNVPCVSRVQSVRHHRNVVYCSWRVRLAQLGAHQLIRCNVTFIQQGWQGLPAVRGGARAGAGDWAGESRGERAFALAIAEEKVRRLSSACGRVDISRE